MATPDGDQGTSDRTQQTPAPVICSRLRSCPDRRDGSAIQARGEAGEDLYGCFLKDYKPGAW